MYRLLFFGTSEFAVASLEALMKDDRFQIVGVITRPDRSVGRHAILTPPPIKDFLLEGQQQGKPISQQPEKLTEEPFCSWLKELGPTCDAFVVVSYGKILPQWLLDLPKKGVLNVHGSLLPKWRGASPIQAAIAAGDQTTGVTIMKMDAFLDHGPILGTAEEEILPTDTGETLHDRLALLGAALLPPVLFEYLEGRLESREQNHEQATTCKILSREDGKIDWTRSAEEIERLIRAYHPWPGTWMEHGGKRLKILEARISTKTDLSPGSHFISDELPHVACGVETSLELITVQPEGKKPMTGKEFLNGQKW